MIQVAQILFILSVLEILHEFGHYITAKMFKVRVEKFYLFMDAGFSLVKKKIGETEAATEAHFFLFLRRRLINLVNLR